MGIGSQLCASAVVMKRHVRIQDWIQLRNVNDCLFPSSVGWWGTWCCWVVSARTTETFDLGSSMVAVLYFWLAMLCIIVSTAVAGGLGLILSGVACASILALRRHHTRRDIREKLGIYGSAPEDFMAHCCCSCCSVCQEAREAKLAQLPARDYCSGELLVGETEDPPDDPSTDMALLLLEGQQEPFLSMVKRVSKTSKFLILMNLVAVLLACLALVFSERAQNILVLLLVFVQPIVIMYFMYWRWYQSYSNLDYVVKMFAVGFWFSTFQSIIIETILQVVISILFYPFLSNSAATDDYVESGGNYIGQASNIYKIVPKSLYLLFLTKASNEEDGDHSEDGPPPPIFFFMLYQAVLAYVLAAGTEETMKHFAVRCCQFPAALKTPQVVLMYLFSAALGFATSENIEYVFGVASATKQSRTSAMEEEIFVLAIRVLMPIHLICSVLQAASLSTVIIIISYDLISFCLS